MRPAARDEKGAVAIIFALMATLIFVIGAMTVDLGNGFMEKRERQKDTDLSTLAAAGISGANLPVSSSTACSTATYSGPKASSSDQAVKDAADNLQKQIGGNVSTYASDWTDCSATNGEVVYGLPVQDAAGKWVATFNKNQVSLISPPKHVDYGLARIIGASGVDVRGVATVGIFSPKLKRVLPYYSSIGCDYGSQTIAQPSNGHSADTVNLAFGSDTNAASLTDMVTSPASAPTAASVAYPVPANSPLVINGTGFTGATQVGFFETGTTSPGPAPDVVAITAANITAGGNKITIPDIQPVGLAQTTYYVRVYIGGKWSDVAKSGKGSLLNALPLTVGSPNLICTQGSSSGNFGSLLLPNSQGPPGQTDNIAYNIAAGLEHGLDYFPSPASPWTCTAMLPYGSKLWPTEGTNCVDTKTGNIAADAAFAGLLTGVGGKQGLITRVDDGTGCAANRKPATTAFMSYTINYDTLSCFFTNSSTTIGDIAVKNYSGPAVLSSAIFDSPRFVYIPVLGAVPDQGGSNKYEIVDFRPAFITDQPLSADKTSVAPTCTANQCTGISLSTNGKQVESLQVLMFNRKALPDPPDGGEVTDYSGTGLKILRLVN